MSLQVGQVLIPVDPKRRGRAFVFARGTDYNFTVVTDYGNSSLLSLNEILSLYKVSDEICSPDVWFNDRMKLMYEFLENNPELYLLCDYAIIKR